MNHSKSEAFISFLDKRTADIQKTVVQLNEDHHRTNIFQIIKTVFLSYRKTPRSEQELRALTDAKLAMFEETWKTFLSKAQEHNDEKRVLQEEVKLEAMKEIRQKFDELWEVPA